MSNKRDWNYETDPVWCCTDIDPPGVKRIVICELGDGHKWFAYQSLEDESVQRLTVMEHSDEFNSSIEKARNDLLIHDAEKAVQKEEHDALVSSLRSGSLSGPEAQARLADILERMGPK